MLTIKKEKLRQFFLTTGVIVIGLISQKNALAGCYLKGQPQRIGATATMRACDRLRTVASWDGFTTNWEECIWNPPPGWVITSNKVHVHSSNNGSRSVSTLASNLKYISSRKKDLAWEQLLDIAAEYTDPNTGQSSRYQGRINDVRRVSQTQHSQYATNKNTLRAYVEASAHGHQIFDKKRGWEEISVDAKVVCLGDPNTQKFISLVSNQIGMDTGRKIYFNSSCNRPIKLALRYKTLNGKWVTKGWWNLGPNRKTYLSSGSDRSLRSNNSIFYYYAEIPGTNYSWKGNENRTFGSRTLPMLKKSLSTNSSGDYTLGLSCGNI